MRVIVIENEGEFRNKSCFYRYLNPPANWVVCSLESRELMALCLKRLKGLPKVKLIDANFVWTEPHSKRIKVKMTVQGEAIAGTILQVYSTMLFLGMKTEESQAIKCQGHDG